MHELQKQLRQLSAEVEAAIKKVGLDDLIGQKAKLITESQAADFWQDSSAAQTTMKHIARLEEQIDPWQSLRSGVADLRELSETDDVSLEHDIHAQMATLKRQYESLKKDLVYSGPHDKDDVIMSIHAGAGGTDAQDWTEMLLRMYTRWAQSEDFEVKTIDSSFGEETGLKSVTIAIDGTYVYGKLKGEHGVHRLVRLSPFNSDNLRQTSFAKVEILPKVNTPEEVIIDDRDLKIDVYRSGGHGGQSVNTTDSAVRITHVPTGISVAIQNERSQLQNRETAMSVLRSRLRQLQIEQHKETLSGLKGPNQSAEWGNQIRSYVLHPYKQVKDLRTRCESSDPQKVLDGNLAPFISAYQEYKMGA